MNNIPQINIKIESGNWECIKDYENPDQRGKISSMPSSVFNTEESRTRSYMYI